MIYDPIYPDAPGHRGVDTSVEAVADLDVGRIQRLSLEAIRARRDLGFTAEELADATGFERTTVQPRTTELRLKGLIGDSGQRRPNRSGKRAIVWACAEFLNSTKFCDVQR